MSDRNVRSRAGVAGIASLISQAMSCQCKRRRCAPAGAAHIPLSTLDDTQAASTVSVHDALAPSMSLHNLPDLTLGMLLPYLTSVDIANLTSAAQYCNGAFACEGLWQELLLLRGFKPGCKSTLAHLHLAETLKEEENVAYFEFMSTDLSSKSVTVVDKFALVMRRHRSATARIEAHAQPGAPPQIASRIALARADVVVNALVAAGVEHNRIKAGGFGTSRSLMDSDESRRAEIFIMMDGMQFPAEALPVVSWPSASRRWEAWVRGEDPGRSTASAAVIVEGEGILGYGSDNTSEDAISDNSEDSSSES